MNSFRCVGLLLLVLLSACDAQKPPAPEPKVAVESKAATQATPVSVTPDTVPSVLAPVEPPVAFKELAREPVHELVPSVAVVPVVITREQPATVKKAVVGKSAVTKVPETAKSESSVDKLRAPIASKTKSASQVVEQTHLSRPNLDLSLPNDMVDQIQPAGKVAPIIHKSVLPSMFGEKKTVKDGPFQINGRLLSNEMQLQLRNESHQQVEGAALDFEFRQ